MSIGVTGVSIAPELGIHFHSGSLSFMERLCCCGKAAKTIELDDQIYIDDKLKAMRWQDKKECNGVGATHARLKLIVVKRLHRISETPFADAERAFDLAQVKWTEAAPIYRSDLDRLNSAVARIKQSLLDNPLSEE